MIDWNKSAKINNCTIDELKEEFKIYINSGKKVWRICDNCGDERDVSFQNCGNLCDDCSRSSPKNRKLISEGLKKAYKDDPTLAKRHSDATKKRYKDPEEREKTRKAALKEKDPLPDGWKIDGNSNLATNKNSASYLGIVVSEQVLIRLFKDIQTMPYNNHGYDFICNRNMKIDAKSSTMGKDGGWMFSINKNTIADYFICIAWDNRINLNILHIWLIPGKDVNHRVTIYVKKSTITKWEKYEQPIDKAILCCNEMKENDL